MPIPTIIEAFFICNLKLRCYELNISGDLKRKLKSEKRASFLVNLNSQQTLKKSLGKQEHKKRTPQELVVFSN